MEHELIDQLNENGLVLGTIDKAVAHEKGLWHRAVHVWVLNDKNEILIQYRCAVKKFFPNMWDCSFAGHIGAGENAQVAAIREGKEELGIDIDISKLKFLFTNKEMLHYKKIQSNEFDDIYLLRQNIEIKDTVLQKEEVGAAKYISLKKFFEMIDNKDKTLIQHEEEYKLLKKYLLN